MIGLGRQWSTHESHSLHTNRDDGQRQAARNPAKYGPSEEQICCQEREIGDGICLTSMNKEGDRGNLKLLCQPATIITPVGESMKRSRTLIYLPPRQIARPTIRPC